jgi:hypothetical protein
MCCGAKARAAAFGARKKGTWHVLSRTCPDRPRRGELSRRARSIAARRLDLDANAAVAARTRSNGRGGIRGGDRGHPWRRSASPVASRLGQRVRRLRVYDRGAYRHDPDRAGAANAAASRGPELGVGHLRRRLRRRAGSLALHRHALSPEHHPVLDSRRLLRRRRRCPRPNRGWPGVAAGEHLFVNTYLVGVTTYAAAGRSKLARYSAELAAVESEHRVLGQTLAGANPPDDLGFAVFEFDRVSQIRAALISAGFGLGKQGASAGRFYDLPQPPAAPSAPISSNEPR